MGELNTRQRRFVEAYDGNGTAAARKAGYTGSDATIGQTAYELLKKPEIVRAIAARESRVTAKHIKTREQRQEFWSHMMDHAAKDSDRLKASELLGRSQADFTERLEVKGEMTILDLVRESMGQK